MSESTVTSGVVHWVGTGLSTGSGLEVLIEVAKSVTLYGRTTDKAVRRLGELGLAGRAGTAALAELPDAVAPGDVVVSMLPASEHGRLLQLCLDRGAHFACTSYTSDELAAADGPARKLGLAVLTEAGLDPGIDHVLAHDLVSRARAAVGEGPATMTFRSYCGGLPAVPNDFRYRFSWAPRGVLSALCTPARSIEDGEVRDVDRPWEATTTYPLDGELFEVYPNRDSLPFVAQYDLPAGWRPDTFVRGTLRLAGWLQAWSDVFTVLRGGDPGAVDALAADLVARYPMRPGDADRVVLVVELGVRTQAADWHGRYLLDLTGDERESAMARTVSLPLAYAVGGLLDGTTPAGLHRALPDPADAMAFLAYLRGRGIDCVLTEQTRKH